MPLLLPLVEWLVPLLALALCALVAAFAVPIVNFVHTGITWFDKAITFLTNKAIDLGIEFTQWLAPHFLENAHRIVNYFHQLGQLAFYAGHFAWRTATTVANFDNWLLHVYLPRKFSALTGHAVDLTKTIYRTIPLSKAQLSHIESAIESHLRAAIAGTIPIAVPHTWPKINWTPKRWREWLGLAAGAGALALPGALAWEREFGKTLGKIESTVGTRLRKMNWLLAFAGAGTLVFAGLAKLGLQWLKCGNVNRLGRVICKMPVNFLEDILGLLTDFLILTNICQVIPLLEDGFNLVEPLIVDFTSGAAALACADKYGSAPALSIPALRLPASPLGLPTLQLP